MPVKQELNIPLLKTVFVADGSPVGNRVPIIFEAGSNDEEFYIGQQLFATVLNGSIPKPKTRGLAIMPSYSNTRVIYWLGSIPDGSKNIIGQSTTSNNTATVHESSNQTTSSILGNGRAFFGNNDGGNLTSSPRDLSMSVGSKTIRLHRSGLNIELQEAGSFSFGKKMELNTTSMNMTTDGNVAFKTKGGSFAITGGINSSKASSGNLTDPEKYLPNEGFFVNTKKTFIRCSGITQLNSGGLKIQLTSSKLSASGKMPGIGSDNTLDIGIIRGNAKVAVGQGNIELRTNNFLMTDTVTVMCGSMINPINSGATFNALSAKMTNRLVWGIDASVELSKASASISAFKDVKIKAKVGSVSVSALTKTSIEAIIAANMKAMKIDIEGKMMVAIKTMQLDLKNSKMIITGPKVTVPGTGPLNCLNVCPFSGAPHGGSQCAG